LQKVRQEFHNHHDHCGAREEEGQMSGMQGNQGRPTIRVVLREDLSKELSFLTVRGDRSSVPLAPGKFWFAVVAGKEYRPLTELRAIEVLLLSLRLARQNGETSKTSIFILNEVLA
jgi:hypothetical protein